MKRISSFRPSAAVSIVVFLALPVGVAFFWMNAMPSEVKDDGAPVPESVTGDRRDVSPSAGAERKLFVSGWLPYWAKEAGAASLRGKLGLFSEINPFAYGVSADGSLVDKSRIDMSPWPELIAEAKRENVSIVPTILWGDAEAMHVTFSDPTLLDRHADAIVAMLDANGFSGVDIDYEGKDIADRDAFSSFLERLHEKLAADSGKTLSCTVEARTQDDPPDGFTGIRAMSYANDYAALDEYCDSVRIMTYDQVFQTHRANTFEERGDVPSAPNADNRWVEESARYALRFISPDKLVLGVSTYGWEFRYEKTADGYRYTRVRSIGYPGALEEARADGATPARTEGGELSFMFQARDGGHIVTVDDGESVREKIDIARKLGLRGISLFKIDGLTDPKVFDALDGSDAKIESHGNIPSTVPIFMYHYIRAYVDPNDPIGVNLSVSPESFEKQVTWLKENGYGTVSMDIFGNPKPLTFKPVVLTFDDGYRDAYDAAFPILRKYGMTGTFYLIVDRVGTPGYLTWDEIAEMRTAGMSFGSHAIDHPDLRNLPSERLEQEIRGSKDMLAEKIGRDVTDFCYPSGKYDDAVENEARKGGYATAVTTRSGIAGLKDDPLTLRRLRITEHADIRSVLGE